VTNSSAHWDFGAIRQHTKIEGNFVVAPASKLASIQKNKDADELVALQGPARLGEALQWCYKINTGRVGPFFARGLIEADKGSFSFRFCGEVVASSVSVKKILFLTSPFVSENSNNVRENFGHLVRNLQVDANSTLSLPENRLEYQTIVLNGEGLIKKPREGDGWFHDFVSRGGNIILLANRFFRGTVERANELLVRYGVSMSDSEEDFVICGASEILKSPVTSDIRNLFWFRPSPICVSDKARLLAVNPKRQSEGYLANCGPSANIFILGVSGLNNILCVGWPYENGKLFANMLSH
jgi:hypothetical protein